MNKLIDLNFWNRKKILITGHTGFKGSWMSAIMNQLNAEIYGLSNIQKKGIYETISNEKIFKREFFTDINNINEDIYQKLVSSEIDYVFHFAAQSLVGVAYSNPKETLMTNIIGTYNILDLFNQMNSTKLISVATTDKVYKNPSQPNKEDAELGSSEFYSLSKVSAEKVIDLFIENQLRKDKYISIVRAGNVIGGGDTGTDRLIPDVVRAIQNKNILKIRNPKSIRPWQHVLDSLYGYILASQHSYKKEQNTVFNLNSKFNNEFTVMHLIREIENVWNAELDLDIESTYKEVEELLIDSSKAKKELNWEATLSIPESINLIHKWETSSNKLEETYKQIQNYFF
tara:strand:+ start:500 stop:1528 length:1029 start_codon:yes stop_codon:yes gene_type:complete